VRLVPLLRVGQRQQDVSLLAPPSLSQLPIAGSLRALVSQILPPAPDLTGRARGHANIMATRVAFPALP